MTATDTYWPALSIGKMSAATETTLEKRPPEVARVTSLKVSIYFSDSRALGSGWEHSVTGSHGSRAGGGSQLSVTHTKEPICCLRFTVSNSKVCHLLIGVEQ